MQIIQSDTRQSALPPALEAILPPALTAALRRIRSAPEELRLHAGRTATVTCAGQNLSTGVILDRAEMKELLARVEAVLRRAGGEDDKTKPRRLVFDKHNNDLDSFELIVDGKRIETPPKEMELLYHLASSPNRVFTRNQLLDEVWGFDYFGDSRTVDVHVKRLREKLEGVSDKWSLKTVWGVGYKFEVL